MGLPFPNFAYSGVLESSPAKPDLKLPDRSWCLPWPAFNSRGPHLPAPFYNSGIVSSSLGQTPIISPSYEKSCLGSNYGQDFIFERTWLYPNLIQMGFIVEQSNQTIQVWNANRFNTVDVTDIAVEAGDGTSLAYDPLPNTINIFSDKNYILTIEKVGPPLQDTTYEFTVGGLVLSVNITGVRVIAFPVDPNWNQGIEQKYSFQSTIFTSKRLVEQRRSLKEISAYSTMFNADLTRLNRQSILNLLSYGKDKVFGVPIYSERMTPTTLTAGTSTIIISEDTADYFNLNNRVDYIIICDFLTGLGEVKKFTSLSGSQINLDQNVINSFTIGRTAIFACAFCFLRAYKGTEITDDLETIRVSFDEFVLD